MGACTPCGESVSDATLPQNPLKKRKTVKNSGLIYENREKVFEAMNISLHDDRVKHDEDKDDEDIFIVDIGCGHGEFTEILCKTFLSNDKDALICLDGDAKNHQFIQNKVIKKNKELTDKRIMMFTQDKNNSLCLTERFDTNMMNICLMAFTIQTIPKSDGSRDSILKETFQCLKENSIFVIFDQIKPKNDDNDNKENNDNDNDNKETEPLNPEPEKEKSVEQEQVDGFESIDDMKQYVESFGFKFEKQILEDELVDNNEFVLVFGN